MSETAVEAAHVLGRGMFAMQNAGIFTCSETEILAEFLEEFASPERAIFFRKAHAMSDEKGDLHYDPTLTSLSASPGMDDD